MSYPGRQGPAVGPLSFSAPAGLVTALDGPSGAGKSTVLGVLAGTVGTGGGTAVSGTLEGFTAGGVAWVPQHPVMVADTVREEVLLYLTAGTVNAGTVNAGTVNAGTVTAGGPASARVPAPPGESCAAWQPSARSTWPANIRRN